MIQIFSTINESRKTQVLLSVLSADLAILTCLVASMAASLSITTDEFTKVQVPEGLISPEATQTVASKLRCSQMCSMSRRSAGTRCCQAFSYDRATLMCTLYCSDGLCFTRTGLYGTSYTTLYVHEDKLNSINGECSTNDCTQGIIQHDPPY